MTRANDFPRAGSRPSPSSVTRTAPIIPPSFQALGDVGFTIPANAVAYWVGEAMGSKNFVDLGEIPEVVTSAVDITRSQHGPTRLEIVGQQSAIALTADGSPSGLDRATAASL